MGWFPTWYQSSGLHEVSDSSKNDFIIKVGVDEIIYRRRENQVHRINPQSWMRNCWVRFQKRLMVLTRTLLIDACMHEKLKRLKMRYFVILPRHKHTYTATNFRSNIITVWTKHWMITSGTRWSFKWHTFGHGHRNQADGVKVASYKLQHACNSHVTSHWPIYYLDHAFGQTIRMTRFAWHFSNIVGKKYSIHVIRNISTPSVL